MARRLGAIAGAVALVVATSPAARAERADETANGGTVHGTFSAQNGVVKWNLTITDTSPDGDCVYIEIQPDLANHTDPEYHSQHACGNGNSAPAFTGERAYARELNGVRLKICNTSGVPDKCVQVDYNANDIT
ncbi:hypothetical protein [Nocardioides conyzicola]|uniref:hypothetical protein n=1 Tax=Nocardioides conyzicola TaxID=1651781 RepID=UPI0031ECFED6